MKTRYRTIVVALIAICAMGVGLLFGVRTWSALYRVTILPSLRGNAVGAHAINDRGQVVGVFQAKDGYWHLFLWDRERGMQDLGVTGDARFDINNAGQIAGAIRDPNGNQQVYLWEADRTRRFLGTLGGKNSQVMGINNRGWIVGTSDLPGGSQHAFLWDPTRGMQDLGTLGGTESYAHAINDAGCIVGLSHTPTKPYQPFIRDPNGGMRPMDSTIVHTGIFRINNGSWVAGQTASPSRGLRLALSRKGATPKELFPLERSIEGPALVNDANQIVFREMSHRQFSWRIVRKLFPSRAASYLWDPNHGRVPLDPYIPARPKEAFLAMDINNEGCIVGILLSGPKYSRSRVVLLEPVPERWGK